MSFFRAAGEDTSYSTESAADRTGRTEDDSGGPSKPFYKVKTVSSEDASSDEQAIARPRLEHRDTERHRDLLLHSLLEEKALAQALQTLNADHSKPDGTVYTSDDPAVANLAQSIYEHLVQSLSGVGWIAGGYEVEAHRNLRDQYRQGIETLAASHETIPYDRALPIRRSSGALTSGHHTEDASLALSRLAIQHSQFRPGEYQQSYDEEPLSVFPMALQSLIESHQVMKLSRYERDFVQKGVLGKGGYGKVFRVQHRLDSMEYAVKQILLSPARVQRIHERGQNELDKVLSEIRTVARLDHPNIVRYYGGWLDYAPLEQPKKQDLFVTTNVKMIANSAFFSSSRSSSTTASLRDPEPPTRSAASGEQSLDILFEDSKSIERTNSESVDAIQENVGPPRLNCRLLPSRGLSNATLSSTPSRKSAVISVDDDDTDIETIPRGTEPIPSSSLADSYVSSSRPEIMNGEQQEPQLTLHIQMGLHPLTLTEYLSSEQPSQPASPACELRHCFHVQTSLRIILAIMDGVQYLHSVGVIHRDLKPSNIFLSVHDGDYRPVGCIDLLQCQKCISNDTTRKCSLGLRIGDFGLVTAIARPDHEPASLAARAVGTELYRPKSTSTSPSAKLDVYSLGVIFFELLWKFETRMERIETLRSLKDGILPTAFSAIMQDGDGALAECLKGMLDDDEHKRLSCQEARLRLQQLIQAFPGT